ncbi:MAG: response regulator [Oscillospiraceae bacterium]|nr:response regulator [Oscillospiraceae bacterium]
MNNNNNNITGIEQNELIRTSHLTILMCFTGFSLALIGESLILKWEGWVLVLIAAAIVFCWTLHIQNRFSEKARLWIYSILMMGTFYYYGIHETSTFDLATVMCTVIILYSMTGEKKLIDLCQIAYFVTMSYEIIKIVKSGRTIETLEATRILLHYAMIIMAGRLARLIIDKWINVLEKSHHEIEQLTDSTERLNDFLANISHELRTPINAVTGLSAVCAENVCDEKLRKEIIAVNEAGMRIAAQVGDILDYSETDSNTLALCNEDYMLSSLLNDLANEVRPYCPDELELIIDVDYDIPTVMNGDAEKLKKILRHLIINGLKYTKEGGVYVHISSAKEDYGINLCIEVKDTGIGMSVEEIERITERFYQVNSGRTRSSGGLGLGMSIVSGFTSALGGFMVIESRQGSGTTVRVSIPQKVIDNTKCISVSNRDDLCLGAFLNFEKYTCPEVREYYNDAVMNIAKGLNVQLHRVDNAVNLKKLTDTAGLTHLFVGDEEYRSNKELIRSFADKMKIIVVTNKKDEIPANTGIMTMEKPFYCFPVVTVLNENTVDTDAAEGVLTCRDVSILVVDDEPMNLTVARSIFGKYGIQVFTAESGQQAIEMCREDEFDIVFMDHMMPKMDGVEAMKHLRSDPERKKKEFPIVALTANAVSTAKEMFLREGFDGFVSKPINLTELERVMKKVLPSSKISYEKPAAVRNDDTPANAAANPAVNADAKAAVNAAAKVIPDNPPEPVVSSPAEILKQYGVDIKTGLDYCMNDEDFYRQLMIQFADESIGKRRDIERFFAEKNLKDYEILVHALKSTSKMIGCTELSEKAKELEFAAKVNNSDFIAGHHSAVMDMYEKLVGGINKAYGRSVNDHDADSSGEITEFTPDGGEEDIFEFSPEQYGG